MPKRRQKGDGAIYYDESRKLYVGQITVGVDENGKRKRKTVYGKTKTEAQKKIKAVEFQIYEGTFVNASGVTLYAMAKQLLDDKLNQGEIKEPTYHRHVETLKRLAKISGTPLQALTETQIKGFLLENVTYSQSTLGKIYNLLKATLKEATRRGIIAENPMEHIKAPKSKKPRTKVRALTRDEQRALMRVLTTEDVAYSRQMLLSLLTGMRMGEINALKVEDVDLRFGAIRVCRTISRGARGEAILADTTKTDAGTRTLPITPTVRTLLLDCIGDKREGFIFTHGGKLITTSQVNLQFGRTCKKYGVLDPTLKTGNVSLHSLRHTYGTRCVEGGMSFKVLQELMGHTDIKITINTYCDATNDFVSENVEKVAEYMEKSGLVLDHA